MTDCARMRHPKRIFVVGCPRSGTTLVQSLLAAHTRGVSIPESHLFNHVTSGCRWQRAIGWVPRSARQDLSQLLQRCGREELAELLSRGLPFRSHYINAFITALDTIAWDASASFWVEKTPSHLRHILLISKAVPGSHFVHVVRRATDTIASLFAVTHRFPERWNGARDIEACVNRWVESIRITDRYRHEPNHTVVSYDELLSTPQATLGDLCAQLEIGYEPAMLRRHSREAEKLVETFEKWKDRNRSELRRSDASKFETILDADQRKRVLDRLHEADLGWHCGL